MDATQPREGNVCSSDIIVSLRNVHKTYLLGLEGVPALRGISLDVKRGEFLIIYGKSGGGKTTLLNMIGTIDRPTKGTVSIAGLPIRDSTPDSILARIRLRHIGFVFQQYNLIPSMTAQENVTLPMMLLGVSEKSDVATRKLQKSQNNEKLDSSTSVELSHSESQENNRDSNEEFAVSQAFTDNRRQNQERTPVAQMTIPQRRQRAKELLTRSGLSHRLDHFPTMLSGGEQQRVTIARAIANEPDIILADEPSANLDSLLADVVIQQLIKLNQDLGVTLIMITHDVHLKPLADRILWMRDGKIAHVEVNPEPIKNSARRVLEENTSEFFSKIESKIESDGPIDPEALIKSNSFVSQKSTPESVVGEKKTLKIPISSATEMRNPLNHYAPLKFAQSEVAIENRKTRIKNQNRAVLLKEPVFLQGIDSLNS